MSVHILIKKWRVQNDLYIHSDTDSITDQFKSNAFNETVKNLFI